MPHNATHALSQSPFLGIPGSESEDLERHVHQCVRANGAWHGVRCAAETVDAFMSGRFFCTVVVASGVLAASVYW